MTEIPVYNKYMLTIAEAASYFHIGEHKLRRLVEENQSAKWLFKSGNRTLIKRKLFEEILDNLDTI